MMFICSLVVCFLALVATITTATGPTPLECIDGERNSSLEYFSMARHKSIGTLKPSFACYMVTQCSIDRLDRLGKQVRAWGGATSAAVYIPTTDHLQQMESMVTLDTFLTSLQEDTKYSGWLVVSLLFGHEASPQLWNCTRTEFGSTDAPTYPINALRNLAVAATSNPRLNTQHVPPYLLYLDADFLPSAGLNDWINQQAEGQDRTFRTHTQNDSVIVLPAFESTDSDPHSPVRPLSKLVMDIRNRTVKQFHMDRFRAGHGASDYKRWVKLSSAFVSNTTAANYPCDPYSITYTRGYEPYYIMARRAFVPYDERFRGYGFNKALNARWLHEHNTTFHVQPGHFVVEDAHAESNAYKKHTHVIDFEPYYQAVREIMAKRLPLVSHNTAQLLTAAGFGAVATETPTVHEAYLNGTAA